MTIGIGGATAEAELARMQDMTQGITPIDATDHAARLARAQGLMREQGIGALYLDATANLRYFTGLDIGPSERLHGAILPADGPLAYLSPAFEVPKTRSMLKIEGEIRGWQEHEDPCALVIATLAALGVAPGKLAVDPSTPFFNVDGLRRAGPGYQLVNGVAITGACRSLKTAREIALMQRANDITLAVHKATARILRPGISTLEVEQFTRAAHRALGGDTANVHASVLFGEATAYPHGVDHPQILADGDMVLVDLGCRVGGYLSDITRTYVFGTPSARQREVWALERAAQDAGFAAARIGAPCEAVDHAARAVIEAAPGFARDYQTPGLPHRTGHGIGIEIHEEAFIVRGNTRPLAAGMCFSIEPMICIYGEFGIRLEDLVYMTEDGPRWFTRPCHSIDDPFGYEAGAQQ